MTTREERHERADEIRRQQREKRRQMDRRREVDRHLLVESVGLRIIVEVAPMLNPGIVDDHIERRMVRFQPIDHRPATFGIGHIADAGD